MLHWSSEARTRRTERGMPAGERNFKHDLVSDAVFGALDAAARYSEHLAGAAYSVEKAEPERRLSFALPPKLALQVSTVWVTL
jgi:hypothetical protein